MAKFKDAAPTAEDKRLVLKRFGAPVLAVKNTKDADRTLTFAITTMTVDRDGEVVVPMGGRFDEFKENPVVLFAHNAKDFPIAVCLDLTKSEREVEALTRFAGLDQHHDVAERAYRMYRDGFMRAVSIGFLPVTVSTDKILQGQTGLAYMVWNLFEFSCVPIPSNPQALMRLSKAFSLPNGATEKDLLDAIIVTPKTWLDVVMDLRPDAPVPAERALAPEHTAPCTNCHHGQAMHGGDDNNTGKCSGKGCDCQGYTSGKATDLSPRLADLVIESMKETWARAIKESGWAEGRAEPEDPIRWNPSLSKAFDITREQYEPATAEIALAARYLDCEVKELYRGDSEVPSAKMGSFLSAVEELLIDWRVDDVRNLTMDGNESPPIHEVIQLNSTRSRDFLINGTRFMRARTGDPKQPQSQLVLRIQPSWDGLVIRGYARREDPADPVNTFVNRAWARAAELNFLKGEAFSLSGEFLPKTEETWDDLFLSAKNREALQRTAQLLIDKGAQIAQRGLLLMGPPGCLHGDTPIYDPVDRSLLTVRERERIGRAFHVIALDADGQHVVAGAEAPWCYPKAKMVRLTFASGRQITVTEGHRFWMEADQAEIDHESFWPAQTVVDLFHARLDVALPSIGGVCGSPQGFVAVQPRSTWVDDLVAHAEDDRRSWRNGGGSVPRCGSGPRRCGGRPQTGGGSDPGEPRRRDDAPPRTHGSWQTDGPGSTDSGSPQSSWFHRATPDYRDPAEPRSADESAHDAGGALVGYGAGLSRGVGRPPQPTDHPRTGPALDRQSTLVEAPSSSLGRSLYTMDRLVKVEDAGWQPYYDFHVPGYQNYWAVGFFHHNTGKTLTGRILRNQAEGTTFIWLSARDLYRSGGYGGLTYGFDLARECAPSILFLEDIDNWLERGTIDLLKTELDGVARSTGVVTMLTTNFPEYLPEALVDRPGRFHDVLQFDLPTAEARTAMVQRWLPELDAKGCERAVAATDGYSGAHVRELAGFARTIHEQDGLPFDQAVERAIAKVIEQRELITQAQTAGSRYRPRKDIAMMLLKATIAGRATPAEDGKPTRRVVLKDGGDILADLGLDRIAKDLHGKLSGGVHKNGDDEAAEEAEEDVRLAGLTTMVGDLSSAVDAVRARIGDLKGVQGGGDADVEDAQELLALQRLQLALSQVIAVAFALQGVASDWLSDEDDDTDGGPTAGVGYLRGLSGKAGRVIAARNLTKLKQAHALNADVIADEESRRSGKPDGQADGATATDKIGKIMAEIRAAGARLNEVIAR